MAWLSNLPSDDIVFQTFDTSSIKVIGFQVTIGISDNEKDDQVVEQTDGQPRAITFQTNANKKMFFVRRETLLDVRQEFFVRKQVEK